MKQEGLQKWSTQATITAATNIIETSNQEQAQKQAKQQGLNNNDCKNCKNNSGATISQDNRERRNWF